VQHQQQVAAAVERAKQVTMQELNAIIGVILLLVADTVFCSSVSQWINCGVGR